MVDPRQPFRLRTLVTASVFLSYIKQDFNKLFSHRTFSKEWDIFLQFSNSVRKIKVEPKKVLKVV